MKLTVILPAYNCAEYIAQTLDMVRMQSFPQHQMETIVVLDGCTDDTPSIVHAYAQQYHDMNLKIIDNKENHGASYSRNIAIKHATGEYIHFLDTDDFINTDFYKNLYEAAVATDADVAVASYYHERYPHDSVSFDLQTVLSNPQDKLNITHVDQQGFAWRYLIRRSFWTGHKFSFPTGMKYCEDMHIMTRCICSCKRLVTVPSARYVYKLRPTSLLNAKGKNKQRDYYWRKAKVSVSDFLETHTLYRTMRKTQRTHIRLFDILPLCVIRKNTEGTHYYVRLFGIVPILKLSIKTKNKPWKL